jgi:hypothetical protein
MQQKQGGACIRGLLEEDRSLPWAGCGGLPKRVGEEGPQGLGLVLPPGPVLLCGQSSPAWRKGGLLSAPTFSAPNSPPTSTVPCLTWCGDRRRGQTCGTEVPRAGGSHVGSRESGFCLPCYPGDWMGPSREERILHLKGPHPGPDEWCMPVILAMWEDCSLRPVR